MCADMTEVPVNSADSLLTLQAGEPDDSKSEFHLNLSSLTTWVGWKFLVLHFLFLQAFNKLSLFFCLISTLVSRKTDSFSPWAFSGYRGWVSWLFIGGQAPDLPALRRQYRFCYLASSFQILLALPFIITSSIYSMSSNGLMRLSWGQLKRIYVGFFCVCHI